VAFRAEYSRLRDILQPGESILASDLLGGCREFPNLSRPPVFVVTDLSMYLLLSGRDKDVFQMEFSDLAGVGRRWLLTREMQLIFKNNYVLNLIYHPRDQLGRTADLVTERFFGHVVKDTTVGFGQGSSI